MKKYSNKYFYGHYFMPGTMLSFSHMFLCHYHDFSVKWTYYCPLLTREERKVAEVGKPASRHTPRSVSRPGFPPGLSGPRVHALSCCAGASGPGGVLPPQGACSWERKNLP